MSDSVLENLKLIIQLISDTDIVKNNAIAVYNQDELEDTKSKEGLKVPFIAVSYPGTTGGNDTTGTGLAGEMVVDIHLVGADKCSKKLKSKKGNVFGAVQLLTAIRNVIRCTKSVDNRKWKFEFEIPSPGDEGDEDLIYVQRWSTTVLLTD